MYKSEITLAEEYSVLRKIVSQISTCFELSYYLFVVYLSVST
jgi:hypothetical protein